ncbi:MAG: sodium-dependent bicarbonate transport family permease [Pirellulales bacterium]
MFKPLLLFFYAGFLIPILGVKFEFPKALYKSITIYLLLAIGWHGGEELAGLSPGMLGQALGFMLIGFLTNLLIGYTAYLVLSRFTRLRRIDAATVAGYYGSDSAGTFVTCVAVLSAANMAFAPYMPVMLAVMEIPGCLVALVIVSKLRRTGMDREGNMPDEAEFESDRQVTINYDESNESEDDSELNADEAFDEESGYSSSSGTTVAFAKSRTSISQRTSVSGKTTLATQADQERHSSRRRDREEELEDEISLRPHDQEDEELPNRSKRVFDKELLHEVFLNPGIYLLFAGIAIGFISRLQGEKVTAADDSLFINLFQGILCLFLLEMGITASSKLRDLKVAGPGFVLFALAAPNLFACLGIAVCHAYSLFLGQPFEIGTYTLFAVLCGAASYIALPAVQRMAIPEASPTLPLAASLGVTFSYNVTIGIPLYIMIATIVTKAVPIN